MRRYYVAFLATPNPENKHPFEILFPDGGPQRQFDTVPAAAACRDFYQGRPAAPYQTDIGSWGIVDLWETLKSPMLITVEV